MGCATGGKHVSAISHSNIHPIENHKNSNSDRILKESVPSRLWNRIINVFRSESRCIRNISVFSQPEPALARCHKVFRTISPPEPTLALYSVAQPESAVFDATYTNASDLSVRFHQLYQNANVFGLKRLFSSAPKVQQLDVNIQRRSRSQAHRRSNIFTRKSSFF